MSTTPVPPLLSTYALERVRTARRWAAFVAAAALVGGGVLLVSGAAGIIAVARAFGVGWTPTAAAAAGWWVVVILVVVVPGMLLQRSVRQLTHALNGGGELAVDRLAGHQRAFWRWLGLIAAVAVAVLTAISVLVVLR